MDGKEMNNVLGWRLRRRKYLNLSIHDSMINEEYQTNLFLEASQSNKIRGCVDPRDVSSIIVLLPKVDLFIISMFVDGAQ